MGMTVHRYKLVTDQIIISKFDPNDYDTPLEERLKYELVYRDYDISKTQEALFERFKDYIFIKKSKSFDFLKSFEKFGKYYHEYEFEDTVLLDPNDSSSGWKDIFLHFQTGEIFEIKESDLETKDVERECLMFENISCFKRMNKNSFWDWTKLDDMDELGNRYHAIQWINTLEDLETARTHFIDDAPIQEWDLYDDEVVYFSW